MNVRDNNDDCLRDESLGHEFSSSELKLGDLKCMKVKIVRCRQGLAELIQAGGKPLHSTTKALLNSQFRRQGMSSITAPIYREVDKKIP
jgi:hypothetical protein